MNKHTIITKVQDCARCGKNHRNIKFSKLTRPMDDIWTHWALCPSNKQPILLTVEYKEKE